MHGWAWGTMSDAWSRLWTQVFGQPPPVTGDAALMARILIESLPYAPPYQPGAAAAGREHPAPNPDQPHAQAATEAAPPAP